MERTSGIDQQHQWADDDEVVTQSEQDLGDPDVPEASCSLRYRALSLTEDDLNL